jgi:hypothetical protein
VDVYQEQQMFDVVAFRAPVHEFHDRRDQRQEHEHGARNAVHDDLRELARLCADAGAEPADVLTSGEVAAAIVRLVERVAEIVEAIDVHDELATGGVSLALWCHSLGGRRRRKWLGGLGQ